jgi:hypothetical protein
MNVFSRSVALVAGLALLPSSPEGADAAHAHRISRTCSGISQTTSEFTNIFTGLRG